jgi:hypothetical protein
VEIRRVNLKRAVGRNMVQLHLLVNGKEKCTQGLYTEEISHRALRQVLHEATPVASTDAQIY